VPESIRALVREQGKADRVYRVDLVDAEGVVHAELEKTINVSAARS
jgi:hypothetical protein